MNPDVYLCICVSGRSREYNRSTPSASARAANCSEIGGFIAVAHPSFRPTSAVGSNRCV